ncbi:MAG: PD-(D/E)XK motif protein [Christensenellaceae bacterium]|jgi:hypothetical protein|nr:PD-(D/E)XK motif protein [Christensenellaceae bacterium]
MNYDSKEKLNSIKEISTYIRVDDNHPLDLYLGLDSNGNKTLRLNEKFVSKTVKRCAKIMIQQYSFDDHNSILFSNCGDDDIFYQFCNNLIEKSRSCPQKNGYQFLLNRYLVWKKMFASNKEPLSDLEIMGLIGELLFLKNYAALKYGIDNAVLGWSGAEPTHKDFSYNDDWFEIKCISASKRTISISSLEQLDSRSDGALVVYKLEKMSESFNGISLNKLVSQINKTINNEVTLDIFENKLFQAGYTVISNYDQHVFSHLGTDKYKVTSEFPRLKRSEIPREIASVKYELDINSIDGYKVEL